ncbi:MAG: transketolase [Planctomycetota bacterium]
MPQCESFAPDETDKKDDIHEMSVNTIRALAMDAVEEADSGHPGTAMALAPIAYVLWMKIMRHSPNNPDWFNRDRFVLSAGHASMLQYAVLHLTGYDISLDDIRNFRQWGTPTPGHPENTTPGVETTTGPLGQGLMNSVGMAMAEAHLAARYNQADHRIVNHNTYAIASDGDMMEGASHEAASLAGHLGLGKLIWVYDQNHITIEGTTEISYSDDVVKRFEGYGWHVQHVGDAANDLQKLDEAFACAREENGRPSLIVVRSHIGYGSPNKQDTSEVHGAPLGEEEIKLTKRNYGLPEDEKFYVPEAVKEHMHSAVERGEKLEAEWRETLNSYRREHPQHAADFEAALEGDLPKDWDADLPVWQPGDGPIATRKAGGDALRGLASRIDTLIGGSGDLAPSTKTLLEDTGYFEKGEYGNRNIAFGIRELGMCGALSGMALHGGVRPFGATFFVFTDYARPAIRLAALMKLPVIYHMTHDSIGVGEDGPTHQPIEHLASLRPMPNLCIIRPADPNEAAQAWKTAVARTGGPTMMVLTRQKLPVLDRGEFADADNLSRGAYVISPEKGETPDAILMASGSEVHVILDAAEKLRDEDIDVRVVSFPSWELFREQPDDYRNEVLAPDVTDRLAVEAGAMQGWEEWIGADGEVIGIEQYGTSAPGDEVYAKYGFTAKNVVNKVKDMITT